MKTPETNNSTGNIIIRLLVGLVFLSEGIQKFLFSAIDGVGRFIKLGVSYPNFFGPFVGATEIVCGSLVIVGLFTRYASFPLFIIILWAIYFTKVTGFSQKGFWATAHDGRADFSMLMGLIFLLIYGTGKFSADNKFFSK